jgi:ligand-binding SRPBCC domain-containing protein
MKFTKSSIIRATPERVFAFHELPDAFERLVPPWENLEIVQKADISVIGSRAIIERKFLGFTVGRWVAEHTKYDPPRLFEDVQVSGPFKYWIHQHIVESNDQGSLLKDEVDYEARFSYFGMAATPMIVLPKMKRMFEYRHSVTKEWCERA